MSFQPSRRFLSACVSSLLFGLAVGLWVAPGASRAQDDALYFVTTGQRLSNEHGFLAHWRTSNGPLTLGAPITPPIDEGGLTVQYFERGRLELHPEYADAVLRGRLGAEYAAALWKNFAPPAPPATESTEARRFSETGYTLDVPFRTFWEMAGGRDVFGVPISAPAWEYVGAQLALVQYFERGRLEQYTGAAPDAAIQIGALGRDLALLRGLSTSPVDPAGALTVDTLGQPAPLPQPIAVDLPAPMPAPTTAPSVAAPPTVVQPKTATAPPQPEAPTATPDAAPLASNSGKSIIVDLSAQWLYAYNGATIVFDAPVSTGRDGFNTPVGRFAIYYKIRSQTMRGCAGDQCWTVPNVPNAMYIVGGVALHGTYWHNRFGSGARLSHGCVNLPLDAATWLYAWAPLGTPVTVRW